MNLLDLNDKTIAVPQSAGINSAAVLCRLIESGIMPKEVHIFYAHFTEHSPGSLEFVQALIELAKNTFPVVKTEISYNSVIDFFEKEKMIPHPTSSICSRKLKIEPMIEYNFRNRVEFDLIGYIKTEKKRIEKQQLVGGNDLFISKIYPVRDFSEDECFEIVNRNLGWYPAIYDLRWNNVGFVEYVHKNLARFNTETQAKLLKKIGTDARVFKHNNCLPCKNMYVDDMLAVEYFYPEYMKSANEISKRLNAYWGRNADEYYTTFGKEDYEVEQCGVCQFD